MGISEDTRSPRGLGFIPQRESQLVAMCFFQQKERMDALSAGQTPAREHTRPRAPPPAIRSAAVPTGSASAKFPLESSQCPHPCHLQPGHLPPLPDAQCPLSKPHSLHSAPPTPTSHRPGSASGPPSAQRGRALSSLTPNPLPRDFHHRPSEPTAPSDGLPWPRGAGIAHRLVLPNHAFIPLDHSFIQRILSEPLLCWTPFSALGTQNRNLPT